MSFSPIFCHCFGKLVNLSCGCFSQFRVGTYEDIESIVSSMIARATLIKRLHPIMESMLAAVIGLMIGAVIMLGYGYNPVAAYGSLFQDSFGSLYSWAESLANATPLILTALTFLATPLYLALTTLTFSSNSSVSDSYYTDLF